MEAGEEAWRVIGRSVQITTLSTLVNIVTTRSIIAQDSVESQLG